MRVYISGPITGDPEYMEKFAAAQERLEKEGWEVINPAAVCAPLPFLSHSECMRLDSVLVDMSDALYFLNRWWESDGARTEMGWARERGKRILYERETIGTPSPRTVEEVEALVRFLEAKGFSVRRGGLGAPTAPSSCPDCSSSGGSPCPSNHSA